MKKKAFKITALVIALGLLGFLAWFANGLLGNPLSRYLADRTAKGHLEEVYGETDFYIDRLSFSFKDTCYHAHILSKTSIDTDFSLTIDMFGMLRQDTYSSVLSGFTTARRLEQAYRELTDPLLNPDIYPIAYGSLEIYPSEALGSPDLPAHYILQDTLIVDGVYDIRELGRQAGNLTVYVDTDTLTAECAAQVLLHIRQDFDAAGVPFKTVDLTLQYPRPDDDSPRPDGYFGVREFLYEDIHTEDLTQRLENAFAALKAYYEKMDDLKS